MIHKKAPFAQGSLKTSQKSKNKSFKIVRCPIIGHVGLNRGRKIDKLEFKSVKKLRCF